MLSSIYYGEIRSDKLESWSDNKDPYNILVENNRVYKLGGWEFLDIANKLFDNEKQVDWGSYAYQCTKEQLERLMEQTGCEIERLMNWHLRKSMVLCLLKRCKWCYNSIIDRL